MKYKYSIVYFDNREVALCIFDQRSCINFIFLKDKAEQLLSNYCFANVLPEMLSNPDGLLGISIEQYLFFTFDNKDSTSFVRYGEIKELTKDCKHLEYINPVYLNE